jgi:hypothetical protein
MSAPQLTDPGMSTEWFRTVEDRARSVASARRRRFQRLVAYAMVGLSGFAVLGLGCFAWRRHALQADLQAPPPSPPVAAVAAAPVAPPPAAPSAEAALENPPPPPLAASQTTPRTQAIAANKRAVTTKKAAVASPFLRNVKPAAKIKARR